MSTPAGLGSLYRQKGSANFSFRLQRRHISTRTSNRTEAERFRLAFLGDAVTQRSHHGSENVTIGELLEDVRADYVEAGRRSISSLNGYLDAHLLPVFASLRATEFTTAHRNRYIQRRRAQKVSDSTINRELETLRRAFNLGKQATPKKVLDPPVIKLIPGADRPRDGYCSAEEYELLIEVLEDPIRLMFILGYHIGWRAGKLKTLLWTQVDLDAGVIHPPLEQATNKWVGAAPIYGDMVGALESAKQERDRDWPEAPWVLRRGSKPVIWHRYQWGKACKAIGRPDMLFHDLRRTAAMNMSNAGIDPVRIQRVLGHKTQSMFARYRITPIGDIQAMRDILEGGKRLKT